MAMIPRPYLFRWEKVDAASDLDRLQLVIKAMPDEELMRTMERERGNGRNDYPIRACWNALLAGVVFQHQSAASLLRELCRNGELRQKCGFDPLAGAGGVPSEDAFGRFLHNVVVHERLLEKMFTDLVATLGGLLPDLGRNTAVDSKAIQSFGHMVRDEAKQTRDGRRDLDADWGKKTYRGVGKDGKPWEKVFSWFGYKLHLLVDATHELPLAYKVTVASQSDTTNLLPLVEEVEGHNPEVAERMDTTSGDRGYDSAANNRGLYRDHGIKPVIDSRVGLWKDKEPTRPVDPQKADQFVYSEKAEVSCICPVSGVQRSMALIGFEKDRDAIKYRCPAAAYGLECLGRRECEALADVGEFGRTLRVPLSTDPRIFVPIPRTSQRFHDLYRTRTAVERVNSRLDCLLGFERHFIRGMKKMTMRVSLALAVMLAMAVGRIRADQKEQMRSLLAPARRTA
jgi:hypothetical protein